MKLFFGIIAVMLVIAAVALPTLMITSNKTEVKTVDLSGIDAEQIVPGINKYLRPDFKSSPVSFMGNSYDLVMAGATYNKIVYQGRTTNNQWYQTEEKLAMGINQEIKQVELVGQTLNIYCGKDWFAASILSVVSFLVFGILGFFAYSLSKKD